MTDQKGLPMDTTPISEAIREMIRIEVELGTMPKTLGPGVYAYREQLLLQWSAHETVLREGLQAIADAALAGETRADLLAVQKTVRPLTRELMLAKFDAERYQYLKANARRIDFGGLSISEMSQLDARIDSAIENERLVRERSHD